MKFRLVRTIHPKLKNGLERTYGEIVSVNNGQAICNTNAAKAALTAPGAGYKLIGTILNDEEKAAEKKAYEEEKAAEEKAAGKVEDEKVEKTEEEKVKPKKKKTDEKTEEVPKPKSRRSRARRK